MTPVPHDFTKPTPLPVEWYHRLKTWWQVSLTVAGKTWAKQLPVPLEASVQGPQLGFAKQSLCQISETSLAYRVKLGDKLVSLLVVPRPLMLNLVGGLLGDKAAAADREITLIEEKLGDYFLIHHWLAHFRESWPGPAGVTWMLDGRETNLACSRLYADAEVLVAMSWQMRGAWGETSSVWLFPKKRLIDLVGNQSASGPENTPEGQVAIRREAIVQQLPMSVEIVLGSAELKLSELSSLQVGDVVLLDQRTTEGVVARAGGQTLFRGLAGRLGSWKAFQVETTFKK